MNPVQPTGIGIEIEIGIVVPKPSRAVSDEFAPLALALAALRLCFSDMRLSTQSRKAAKNDDFAAAIRWRICDHLAFK